MITFLRYRERRDAAEKEEGAEEEEKKEGIVKKTEKEIVKLEKKAENILKPVADKIHVKPW